MPTKMSTGERSPVVRGGTVLWQLRRGLCFGGDALSLMVGQKFLSPGAQIKATCESNSLELFWILSQGLLGEARSNEQKGLEVCY